MVVRTNVVVDGHQGYRNLIAALQRTDLEELLMDIHTNISTFNPQLLRDLDNALDGNTSVYSSSLESEDAGMASSVLERLVLLKPLKYFSLYLGGQSIVAAATGLGRLLDAPTAFRMTNLTGLHLTGVVFDGDFAVGWAALQRNNTLKKVSFILASFDANNTNAVLEWLRNLQREVIVGFGGISLGASNGLEVTFYASTFHQRSIGSVAGSILVSTPMLRLLGLRDTAGGSDNTADVGIDDLVQTLSAESDVRKSLPRLLLEVKHSASVDSVHRALPEFVNLRRLDVRPCDYLPPPTPIALQTALDGLHAAMKGNGSLYSSTRGLSGSLFLKRNKGIPKMLLTAQSDRQVRRQVPKLFVAAMQSPKLQANTLLSAMKVWPQDTVLGPSDKAQALAAILKAQKACTAASAVYANEMARLVAAKTKVATATEIVNAFMAKVNMPPAGHLDAIVQWGTGMVGAALGLFRPVDVAAQGATLEKINAALTGHDGDGIDFWEREAVASSAEAAGHQEAANAAMEAVAANAIAEEATEEVDYCLLRVKKAAEKAAKMKAELAAVKAVFLVSTRGN